MSLSRDDMALAGEFVLGVLDRAERASAERRIQRDPAFAAAVADWQRHFAGLDAATPGVTPPPALWSRIEASRLAQGAARPAGTRRPLLGHFWDSLRLWRPLGLAGTLASLVLGIALLVRIAAGPEAPHLVAVLSAPDGRTAAVVNAYANGTVQLIPLDTIPVPDGRVLEVWTLQTREQGPVSLARMDKARTIRLDLRGLSPAQVGHLFEITLEPQGGSPTGKPTGPILMKGLAATRL
ncbi:MAG: anti-sigma factor [Beijerinckiaceae bacterium]|jgi:anti-sigma-K factor RskA|nr:anti-sigma factor [Beijerinckiaceae bacterium]